ncbi:MAG: Uma2 family endonuclease, partial [Coleofasciculus sp. C2-GNP5-27]
MHLAGIVDYWVFNVTTQQLHVFRDPQVDGYQRQLILKGQQSIDIRAFPNCTITVHRLGQETFRRNVST